MICYVIKMCDVNNEANFALIEGQYNTLIEFYPNVRYNGFIQDIRCNRIPNGIIEVIKLIEEKKLASSCSLLFNKLIDIVNPPQETTPVEVVVVNETRYQPEPTIIVPVTPPPRSNKNNLLLKVVLFVVILLAIGVLYYCIPEFITFVIVMVIFFLIIVPCSILIFLNL